MASNRTRTAVILAAVILVSSIGLPLMAGTTVAQENNTTATDDSTTTTSPAAETCENPTTPQMDQGRRAVLMVGSSSPILLAVQLRSLSPYVFPLECQSPAGATGGVSVPGW